MSMKGYKHTNEWRINHSLRMKGKNNSFYGKHHSEETKRKISEAHKGNKNCIGRKMSEETKRKIGEANKGNKYCFGRKMGDYTKMKLYEAHIGKKLSEETKRRMSKAQKGRKHSDESRAKISESQKGHIVTAETRRKISKIKKGNKYCLGRIISEETKKKMSEKKKLEKNANWFGGKSFEPYGNDFNNQLRNQIRARDNFECQQCHQTQKQAGYKLDCHHIDYNKQNNNKENIITLCRSCHTKTNLNRKEWTKYFRNMTAM